MQVPVPLNDLSSYRDFERLLQQPGEHITLPYGPNNINSLQTFVPVNPTKIEVLLSQLNPRKSAGPDMISPFELKMIQQQISTQLSIIFNESLTTGVLPAEFKTGNISPIRKPWKRDNTAPSSYRGIFHSRVCWLKFWKILYTNNWKHISTRLEHTMRTSMQFQERAFMCQSFTCNDWWLDDRKRSQVVHVRLLSSLTCCKRLTMSVTINY